MQPKTALAALLAVSGLLLLPLGRAEATVLTFALDSEYTSGVTPAGPGPWLTATFDDHGVPGSVTLTVTANLAGPSEFATKVLFNFDPALDPGQLTFSAPAKTGTFADPLVATGVNAFSSGGGADFDLLVQFDNSPPANRFGGTESVTYTIGGLPTLTAGNFDFTSSSGGQGSLVASAHVQGVGDAAQNSSWVTVPEPASTSVFLLAASAILLRRLRRVRCGNRCSDVTH